MLSSMTGIRGYAVLLVLLSHASNYGYNLNPSLVFSGAGRYGVFLFFVLSSFLLTRQFLLWVKTDSPLPSFLKHYFLRRFLRIFPLYLACLLVYLAVSTIVQPLYIDDVGVFFRSLLLLDGPGVFWTIPVEFQYYFLLPVVALGMVAAFNSPILVALVTGLFIFVWQSLFEPVYKPNLLPFLSIFVVGSFSAYVYEWFNENCKNIVSDQLFKRFCGLVALLTCLSFIFLIANFYNMLLGTDIHRGYFHYDFVLWAVLSSLLLLSVLWSDGILRRFFDSKFMVFWGEVSFSAYLGHMLILKMFKYFDIDFGSASVVLFIVLVGAFSYLSFRFFELPISRIHQVKKLGFQLSRS